MIKNYFLLSLFVLVSLFTFGQKHTISGYISDKESGERLIFSNIYNTKTLQGTTANNYGFYSLSLPAGQATIAVSFTGYSPQTITLDLKKDTTINFQLNLNVDVLSEVTVVGTKSRVEETQMSVVDVPIQKLQSIPVILGEADVLKVMQLLPGVKGGTEGTSGI